MANGRDRRSTRSHTRCWAKELISFSNGASLDPEIGLPVNETFGKPIMNRSTEPARVKRWIYSIYDSV
jgi:hypothetical protein